jgi:uncharacterized membrane protein YphA (DoxX/SURF4 family)
MAVQHDDSGTAPDYADPSTSPRPASWLDAVWAPRVLSVARVVIGLIFMEHGTQKWLNFPPLGRPAPELFSMSGFRGILELVGGALLVLGLFTRPVAFLLSGEMAIAYWSSHAPRGFSGAQWRRRRDPLLLHLPLPLRRGSGPVEPGRDAQPGPGAATLDFRRISCYMTVHRRGCPCIRIR